MSLGHVAIALVLLCVIPALIGFLIDPNDLSIHSFYRDSLVRTFLGASRKRSPDPITGMDSDDDLSLVDIGHVPLHVINAAKRVRLDGDAAAFGPMTTSFTFSPLHCGSEDTYRPSTEYGKRISLGTAVAISGAAIALNLRAASPLVTLARSLLSSGLGIWLGNPVHATAWSRRGPGHPLVPLWEEFFARSTYLHISDGGHFENLGVYEMLRRRCRTIVVVDASWDPIGACADLVGLMYRARSELQTSIDVDIKGLQDAAGRFLHHVALGKISYPDAAIGEIHYIKPVLTGNEDMEVRTYHALNNAFPQETTLDQWFTGSQFEAYRQLGLQSGRELVERRLKEAVTEQERQPFA